MNLLKNLNLTSKACVRVDEQLSKSSSIKKGVRQDCPLSHQFYLTCSLMTIFNKCDKFGISVGDKYCYGDFFLQMTLCYMLQQDLNLKKLLKLASKWARYNENAI